jgi:uncharacterized coiled-coil DUF342 family protein
MTRANKALAVLVISSIGLWGCAQGPANGPGAAERIRALENKNAKLEDDFRAAVAVRDQLRKKLAAAEEQRTQLGQEVDQLKPVTKERDNLKQERDLIQTQLEQLRKGMRSLLGQVESASGGAPTQPVTSAATTSAEKS